MKDRVQEVRFVSFNLSFINIIDIILKTLCCSLNFKIYYLCPFFISDLKLLEKDVF